MDLTPALFFFGIISLTFAGIAAAVTLWRHKSQRNKKFTLPYSSSSPSSSIYHNSNNGLKHHHYSQYGSTLFITRKNNQQQPPPSSYPSLPHPNSSPSSQNDLQRKNYSSLFSSSAPGFNINTENDNNNNHNTNNNDHDRNTNFRDSAAKYIRKKFSAATLINPNSSSSSPSSSPPVSSPQNQFVQYFQSTNSNNNNIANYSLWSPFEFSSIGYGIFAQDDPSTNDSKFNYLKNDFGLILHGSWHALNIKLNLLQDEADRSYRNSNGTVQTKYKLLFVARHGQGYHNLAIEIYGQKAWDDYWSKKNGDGNIVWGPDPELTPLGVEQAKKNNIAWKKQISDKQAPVPDLFFVSPFTRATDTAIYTWLNITRIPKYFSSFYKQGQNRSAPSLQTTYTNTHSSISLSSSNLHTDLNDPLNDEDSLAASSLVVEDLRETIGVHTCDERSTKSQIHSKHPLLPFEPGFTESDELWTSTYRETPEEQDLRIQRFLERLFCNSDLYKHTSFSTNTTATVNMRNYYNPHSNSVFDLNDNLKYVSVTAHSGTINSILKVTNHRPFNVPPGGMIPVLIKATRYRQVNTTSS